MFKKVRPTIVWILFLVACPNLAFSQSYWEPVSNITGYVTTEFNYFDGLNDYLDPNYGAAVSEAGVLMTYRPTEEFTLKAVMVYRPTYGIDQIVAEAYGDYKLDDLFHVRVGRFLTPLSPMKTNYYAPVNTTATLPINVANYEFTPLNIEGLLLHGQTGESFKAKYSVYGGGYRVTTFLPAGAVGFFGRESDFLNIQRNAPFVVSTDNQNTYNLAYGANVTFNYEEYVELGFSYHFERGRDITLVSTFPDSLGNFMSFTTKLEKAPIGVNLKLKFGNTTVQSEYWDGNASTDGETAELAGFFAVLSHQIDKFIPYARFERQEIASNFYDRWTAGVNFKPTFTTSIKAEYIFYDHAQFDVNGMVATVTYSF